MRTKENDSVASIHQEKAKKLKTTPLANSSQYVGNRDHCVGDNSGGVPFSELQKL